MTDYQTTVARAALEKAAKAFREYEAHHFERAQEARSAREAAPALTKAARNRELATECEMALHLLEAE